MVVWAWISQVLDTDKSLSNAVKRVIVWLAATTEAVPSADTGAYSKARQQQWCGRRVKAYDGTTPVDERYPGQPGNLSPAQQCWHRAVGFPWRSWWSGASVTTGAVLEVGMATLNTSEWQLARQLYATLQPEDVVVADSAYGTYVDLAASPCGSGGCGVS